MDKLLFTAIFVFFLGHGFDSDKLTEGKAGRQVLDIRHLAKLLQVGQLLGVDRSN